MYTLLSGEHLANYLTRFAVPYLVPFLCQQHGFSEARPPHRTAAVTAAHPSAAKDSCHPQ